MKMLLVLLLLWGQAMACEDHAYIKAGLGKNMILFSDEEWNDGGSVGGSFGVGYRQRFGKSNFHGTLSYDHFSQPGVGPPFGKKDDTEDSLDAFYAGVEYHFK